MQDMNDNKLIIITKIFIYFLHLYYYNYKMLNIYIYIRFIFNIIYNNKYETDK